MQELSFEISFANYYICTVAKIMSCFSSKSTFLGAELDL